MSKIIQELTQLGYKEFPNDGIFHPNAKHLFQKRITSDEGTLYFINVALYDLSGFQPNLPDKFCEDLQPSYTVQFQKDGNICNVEYFAPDTVLVEEFFHKMFVEMKFDNYD